MTYTIGFSIDGTNSILSDTRVTSIGTQRGQNTAIKTGILSAGCIYGLAGNVDNAFQFINAAKIFVSGASDISQSWEKLNELVSFYDFPSGKEESFQILFSFRHSGNPEFYILSSNRELVRSDKEWVSIGSGKEILDPLVEEKYLGRIREAKQALKGNNPLDTMIVYPYFLCLMLSELTLTFQRSVLEKAKVGGIFNFVYQTSADDNFQKPAVYIFCDVNRKTKEINLWRYRVCRIQEGLYIQCNDPSLLPGISEETYEAFIHDPAILALGGISDLLEFERRIREKVDSLPYYYFYGVGYVNPIYQFGHECHIALSSDQAALAVGQEIEISEKFEELIKNHFANRRGLPGGGEGTQVELLH